MITESDTQPDSRVATLCGVIDTLVREEYGRSAGSYHQVCMGNRTAVKNALSILRRIDFEHGPPSNDKLRWYVSLLVAELKKTNVRKPTLAALTRVKLGDTTNYTGLHGDFRKKTDPYMGKLISALSGALQLAKSCELDDEEVIPYLIFARTQVHPVILYTIPSVRKAVAIGCLQLPMRVEEMRAKREVMRNSPRVTKSPVWREWITSVERWERALNAE